MTVFSFLYKQTRLKSQLFVRIKFSQKRNSIFKNEIWGKMFSIYPFYRSTTAV